MIFATRVRGGWGITWKAKRGCYDNTKKESWINKGELEDEKEEMKFG